MIDTCSRFCQFWGTALDGRVSYALGYTGLGVAASRFGARVALDPRRGAAEAIEAVVHGSNRRSQLIGRRVEDVKLPEGAAIIATVRGEQVIMAHHDTIIEAEDHVIVFVSDRRHVEAVERLFQGES